MAGQPDVGAVVGGDVSVAALPSDWESAAGVLLALLLMVDAALW